MKIFTHLFVLASVAVLIAGPASAQSTGSSKAMESHGGASASAEGDFTGRHTMEGTVTRVHNKTGEFSLKTSEGTLALQVPPSALAGVKKGDRMSVEIAVKPEGSASMGTTGGSASPATGSSTSTGTSGSSSRSNSKKY